jgi:hypothetical protein
MWVALKPTLFIARGILPWAYFKSYIMLTIEYLKKTDKCFGHSKYLWEYKATDGKETISGFIIATCETEAKLLIQEHYDLMMV